MTSNSQSTEQVSVKALLARNEVDALRLALLDEVLPGQLEGRLYCLTAAIGKVHARKVCLGRCRGTQQLR